MPVTATPAIDDLPDAPQRLTDGRDAFATKADPFVAALDTLGDQVEAAAEATEANALYVETLATSLEAAARLAADATGFAGTSTSVLTIDDGAKIVHLDGVDPLDPPSFVEDELIALIYRPDPTVRLLGSLTAWDGVDEMTVTVAAGGVIGSGGPFANWLVVSSSFFSPGATATEIWAGETDGAAITPLSQREESARQALTFGSTVTPNMAQGWNRSLTAPSSFTMGAPINCWPGQVIKIDITNSAGSVVMAVNAAWKRESGLAVIGPNNTEKNRFVGFVEEVDGSGVMTLGVYDTIRTPS